jgi:general stress protein 26
VLNLTSTVTCWHCPELAAHESNQINLIFLANRASHKFDELENDSHVNVAFYDEKTTHWASYSGVVRISQDKDLIAKHWSALYVLGHALCNASAYLTRWWRISAWFGDLGDGIHKGDKNDPRIAVIEVIPDEVRYWLSTSNVVTKAADIVTSATTGKVSAPGELRTITKDEVGQNVVEHVFLRNWRL